MMRFASAASACGGRHEPDFPKRGRRRLVPTVTALVWCIMDYAVINFPVHGDKNGKLVALEKGEDFPFEIKRVYYIWDTVRHAVRGSHSHRNLEQVIVCMSGSCDFMLDDGTSRETVHLNSPTQGLHIKSNIWREFTNFSPGCVVMVLASQHYDANDYIRDYEEFLRSLR